ncbi:MAG: transcriptional regulator [Solirubrobacteraceae bacterium]|nr:transcriptional regulator [Solirubrobacteraceae bacterium]
MPEPGLDPVIHAAPRLKAMAMLAAVDVVEFARIRDALEVSDSVLSKHLAALNEAGYVENRKLLSAGRRTTWLALTPAGRRAWRSHVAALRALIEPDDE